MSFSFTFIHVRFLKVIPLALLLFCIPHTYRSATARGTSEKESYEGFL